jgi:hypothetical protein
MARRGKTERGPTVLAMALVMLGGVGVATASQSVLPRFAEDGPARALRQVREQRGAGTELRYVQAGQNRAVCGYVGRAGQKAAVAFVSRPSRILFSDDPLIVEFREARERYCPDLLQAPAGTG